MSPVVIGVHSGLYQHIRNSFENQSVVAGFAGVFFCCFFFQFKSHDLVYDANITVLGKKERKILVNDALDTFYLRLYCVGYMTKEHSYSKRGNLLPPLHGLQILRHWI